MAFDSVTPKTYTYSPPMGSLGWTPSPGTFQPRPGQFVLPPKPTTPLPAGHMWTWDQPSNAWTTRRTSGPNWFDRATSAVGTPLMHGLQAPTNWLGTHPQYWPYIVGAIGGGAALAGGAFAGAGAGAAGGAGGGISAGAAGTFDPFVAAAGGAQGAWGPIAGAASAGAGGAAGGAGGFYGPAGNWTAGTASGDFGALAGGGAGAAAGTTPWYNTFLGQTGINTGANLLGGVLQNRAISSAQKQSQKAIEDRIRQALAALAPEQIMALAQKFLPQMAANANQAGQTAVQAIREQAARTGQLESPAALTAEGGTRAALASDVQRRAFEAAMNNAGQQASAITGAPYTPIQPQTGIAQAIMDSVNQAYYARARSQQQPQYNPYGPYGTPYAWPSAGG